MNAAEAEENGRIAALERGQQFITSLMAAAIEAIPNSDGMHVVKNVLDLETGETGDIIRRTITEPFWNECIKVVDTPGFRLRVAAIGTPGIGKTTSTPLLIRMLLERGQTVVYLIRTRKASNWYYEFVPLPGGKQVTTQVYPEKLPEDSIPSLIRSSSYYIVDPGRSKDYCNPPTNFEAKCILVPSPDSGHWGGSEFTKRRGNIRGRFRYFPTWSLEELVLARPTLRNDLTEEEVRYRFRQFGGIPRHIFAWNVDDLLEAQDDAVAALTSDQAKRLHVVK